nr:peptidyl-prolyl cis-trans isomerase [Alphaproteobacteria bacterium]
YVLQNTKYTADIYSISHNAVEGIGNPDDAELKAYYDAHQDKYQRPEMRRMTMAVLSTKDWQKNLSPSAAELKEIYDTRKPEFSEPEERSVQFVVLPDEETARKTAERARGGEKLATAASAVAGKEIALKTMEKVKAGALPANLDSAVFKLPRAETSEPVNTPLGWYVMQITHIKTGLTPPMESIKDKLVAAWRNDQAGEKLPKLLDQLDDDIAGGASLEEIAKNHRLQLRQLPIVTANGQGEDDKINLDSSMKEVLAAGFKQNQGEIGNMFETASGDYAVVRVDEVRTASVAPLAEIRQEVIADWRNANARQIAEKAARELASKWRSAENVGAEASKIGAKLSSETSISREVASGESLSVIDRAVMQAGQSGDVVTATDSKTEYVAKLRAISAPNPASVSPAALAEMQTLATEWVKNDYLQSFLNALEKSRHVEVNEKAIAQIYNTAN